MPRLFALGFRLYLAHKRRRPPRTLGPACAPMPHLHRDWLRHRTWVSDPEGRGAASALRVRALLVRTEGCARLSHVYAPHPRVYKECVLRAVHCLPWATRGGPRSSEHPSCPSPESAQSREGCSAARAEPRTHRCLAAAAAAPVQPHIARTSRIVGAALRAAARRGRDGSGGADAWALRKARVHGRTQDNGGCGMVMGEQSAGELRHNCVSGNECGLEVRPHRAALSYPSTALGFGPVLH